VIASVLGEGKIIQDLNDQALITFSNRIYKSLLLIDVIELPLRPIREHITLYIRITVWPTLVK
jgi:hypothetical protein